MEMGKQTVLQCRILVTQTGHQSGESYFPTLLLSCNLRPAVSLAFLVPGNATGCGVGSMSPFLRQGNGEAQNNKENNLPWEASDTPSLTWSVKPQA